VLCVSFIVESDEEIVGASFFKVENDVKRDRD
jgi:hypothetical protein